MKPARLLPARLLTALSLTALSLAACDDTPGDTTPTEDRRARLTGEAVSGDALTVRIEAATPDPPVRGDVNTWRFMVLDASGAPVEGCTVAVDPTMPAHGHGTTPIPTVTAVEGTPGLYEARPLNLFMPGEWHVAVEPSCGAMHEVLVFVVPIES